VYDILIRDKIDDAQRANRRSVKKEDFKSSKNRSQRKGVWTRWYSKTDKKCFEMYSI
jgi:hypothetical protein